MLQNQEQLKELIPILLPLAVALLVLVVVMAVIRRIRNRLVGLRPQHQREIRLTSKAITFAVFVVIVMATLESLNVPLGNVWTAVSTVLALVAIGFVAVWSILSHMTASVVILLQRPFRTGDYLQLADDEYSGRVTKTGLFYTEVEDSDGGRSLIPNNLLFQRRFRITPEKPVARE